ncbi:hypothetical protein [Streptomyces sp. NPDC057363]|uniref:hypothetical protein n=1 Tax=Streptomyces sp. NPDC057363 TaxID=3346107 RepID=UPI00363623C0
MERVFLCAGAYFALERWHAGTAEPMRHSFATAQILSNVGAPVRVRASGWNDVLGRAETLVLPAACGEVKVTGPADVLLGYLPDLDRGVCGPLLAAGYPPPLLRHIVSWPDIPRSTARCRSADCRHRRRNDLMPDALGSTRGSCSPHDGTCIVDGSGPALGVGAVFICHHRPQARMQWPAESVR